MSFDLTKNSSEDMSDAEKACLVKYIQDGCPGFASIDEGRTFRWFELYMSGKNYSEISKLTNERKELILYIAAKLRWHDKRIAYYAEISDRAVDKMTLAKLESVNTMTAASQAFSHYFGKKFNNYIATKDETIMEEIDTKLLAHYYKTMETIESLAAKAVSEAKPKEESKQDVIDISTDSDVGSILRQLTANKIENNKK